MLDSGWRPGFEVSQSPEGRAGSMERGLPMERCRPDGGLACPASPSIAGDDARSEQGSGDDPAEAPGVVRMDRPILTPHDGCGEHYDGENLMNEIFDLIRRRLPLLPPGDPVRRVMHALLPRLAVALGRPRVLPARDPRPRAADL